MEERGIGGWVVGGIEGLGRERLHEGVSGKSIENGSFDGRCPGCVLLPVESMVLVLYLSSRKMGFGRKVLPSGVGSSDLDGRCSL
jgi:hypothetical protein